MNIMNIMNYIIYNEYNELYNEFFNTDEKQISSYNYFSRKVKSKLLTQKMSYDIFEISQKLLFKFNFDF